MMIADPKNWEVEARSRFRQTDLPVRDWPMYRDRFIVMRARELADRHQAQVMGGCSWKAPTFR